MNPFVRPGGGPASHGGQLLARRLPPLMARLRGPAIDELATRLADASPSGSIPEPSPSDDDAITRVGQPGAVVSQLADLLTSEGLRILEHRREAERTRTGFLKAVRRAPDALALQALLRHHLRTTRSGMDLRRDLRALKRWLDADALVERMDAGIEALGTELELVCNLLEGLPLRDQGIGLLRHMLADPRLPTRRAAVSCLSAWVVERIQIGGLQAVPSELLRQLLQIARQRQGDPLTARRALRVLLVVAPEEQEAMLLERLTPAEQRAAEEGHVVLAAWARDDFLVRAEAARISQQAPTALARRAATLARRDPSETVRCALADGLTTRRDLSSITELERMAREDPALTVRLHARARLGQRRGEGDPRCIPDPVSTSQPRLGASRGDSLEAELAALAQEAARIPQGRSRTLLLPDDTDPMDLARALLPWAEHDHGFSMQPRRGGRVTVYRGVAPVPRLWRMIHELRHPSPAKRQVGDHISGATMHGAIRVPPARMAEVSATGVPNQRVFSPAWGSWAPWLPQPEDYLDALGHGSTVVVSREGVTTIQSPPSFLRRMVNAFWFTWSMSGLDLQRQHALAASEHRERFRYVQRLEQRGYTTHFDGHDDQPQVYAGMFQYFDRPDPEPDDDGRPDAAPGRSVRVLGVGAPLLWETFRSLVGVRHNLPSELATVCVALAVVFFGRLSWYLHRTRRARKRIPLVMGGWGTRGKSGTERLKAAVFQGMGFDAICKTTGCEAMLLHAPAGGRATELFLYRPYERASIWEHADTLELAARLGAPVFLWECMALRPDYVEQLQLWWTRDDLSTITNTYPDHEDVQGPTGRHVAETIASFVPRDSLLISTEQQMLPVLRDRCAKRNTHLLALTEEHVSSLPADLLARIPYQEHPANVALVASMAEALGIPQEEAIVMMADHVVPDLGSLASYGPMRHAGRVIEMVNGMSANERTGFINNWQRAGFASWDPKNQADTFLVTVVNNRRDRVPRSRIFAEILANDAPAHRHVLIGTNLEGLQSYLDDALNQRLRRLDPFAGGDIAIQDRLDAMASFLRIGDPSAMLRATASDLGLPPAQVSQAAAYMDEALESAPAEPMDLAEARERLSALRPPLEALAAQASGIFDRLGSPTSSAVHPRLEAPLFHDEQDHHEGVAHQAELWLDLAAEALAFASLRRACMGHGIEAAVTPPPPPVALPPVDDEVTELLVDEDVSAAEALFWSGPEDEDEDEDEGVIAMLPAEDTDPGLDFLSVDSMPAQVLVHEVPEPRALMAERTRALALPPERQDELRRATRSLFREVFRSHLVIVPSADASGDQVIDVVARSCPAGARVRVMGIQNIKGTGLDFVYRWVHASQPLRWAEDLFHPDRSVQLASLSRLERWREWSIPSCQEVLRALAAMNADSNTSQARATVQELVGTELERRRTQLQLRVRTFSLSSWLGGMAWLVWDPFDALFRRWRADRIWADLAASRISHARAAKELADVAQRQRQEDSTPEPSLMP